LKRHLCRYFLRISMLQKDAIDAVDTLNLLYKTTVHTNHNLCTTLQQMKNVTSC
jgi:hypothetical protein